MPCGIIDSTSRGRFEQAKRVAQGYQGFARSRNAPATAAQQVAASVAPRVVVL